MFGIASFAQAGDVPQRVSVCELVKDPPSFVGHRVEVAGEVHSDGMDYIMLVDRACNDGQISIAFSDETAHHADVDALSKAIFGDGAPGTVGKEIKVTVVGMFAPYLAAQWPFWQLNLEGVLHLDVKHVPLHIPR